MSRIALFTTLGELNNAKIQFGRDVQHLSKNKVFICNYLNICSIISYFQNPWNTILGDCSVVDQYLLDKPVWSLKWFIPHYLNVLLRAAGQVSLHL